MSTRRVEWTELGNHEPYRVIGDLTPDGWEFWEKSVLEIRWYPMVTTPQLIAKAERTLKGSACSQAAA
jgi:hypothetical protein